MLPCQPHGKAPLGQLAPHGCKDATTDLAVVAHWWNRNPFANVAVATGRGLAVVDVDPRNGGTATRPDHLGLPPTLTSATANGGRHFFYEVEGDLKGGVLVQGVDLKARGGYVLVAPSALSGGRRYAWLDVRPLAVIRAAWLAVEGAAPPGPGGGFGPGFEPAEAGSVGEGGRHAYLLAAAGWMAGVEGLQGAALERATYDEDLRACASPMQADRRNRAELDALIAYVERAQAQGDRR